MSSNTLSAESVPVEFAVYLAQHLNQGSDLINALPEFSTTMERLELYHLYQMSMLDVIQQYTKQQLNTQMGDLQFTTARINWVIKSSQQQAMAYWAKSPCFKHHIQILASLNLPFSMVNQINDWCQGEIGQVQLLRRFDL